jgi:hypothetical protein
LTVTDADIFYEALPHEKFTVDWISVGAEAVLGVPIGRILAQPRLGMEYVDPDDRDSLEQYLASLMYRELATAEYRWHATDGTYRWLRNRGALLRDPYGRRRHRIVGSWCDVTPLHPS